MASFVQPHTVWAVGHGIMLLSSAYVLLQTVLFRGTPQLIYRLGFTGALLSYSIVVFKSLGRPQPSAAWVRRAFVDENVQYAVLALYWWISKPINLAIIPFATFSLFHTLTFLRTNVIPKFVPPSTAGARPAGQQQAAPVQGLEAVSRRIQVWVKNNYDGAMRFVAYAELAILARVTVGALTFRSSFIAPIFLAHFIRLRYHASPFSRQAITHITSRIDTLAGNQGGAVANGWSTVKRLIGSWGGGKLVSQPAGAGPQGAQGGAAAQAQARRQQ